MGRRSLQLDTGAYLPDQTQVQVVEHIRFHDRALGPTPLIEITDQTRLMLHLRGRQLMSKVTEGQDMFPPNQLQ